MNQPRRTGHNAATPPCPPHSAADFPGGGFVTPRALDLHVAAAPAVPRGAFPPPTTHVAPLLEEPLFPHECAYVPFDDQPWPIDPVVLELWFQRTGRRRAAKIAAWLAVVGLAAFVGSLLRFPDARAELAAWAMMRRVEPPAQPSHASARGRAAE